MKWGVFRSKKMNLPQIYSSISILKPRIKDRYLTILYTEA